MKKYFLVLLIGFLTLMPGVKAETLTCDYTDIYSNIISTYGKDVIVNEVNNLYNLYKSDYQNDYPYFSIHFHLLSGDLYSQLLVMNNFKVSWSNKLFYMDFLSSNSSHYYFYKYNVNSNSFIYSYDGDPYSSNGYRYLQYNDSFECTISPPFYSNTYVTFIMPSEFTEVRLQESPDSTTYRALNDSTTDYVFGDYSKFIDGVDFPDNNLTTVNLDDYEYVILNLKDYSKKEAFSTNLKVKGMVGITPVYEFGTAEKTEITDRCNLSYSDYTDYRFYVLKSDLQNNSVYYVKACESGSSFKFDNSVFDITYVTSENKDSPIITVNGQEYNTIPFDKLSNSANKNEENNFVPGESGSSLTNVIDNITDYISSFWKSLTSFMSLVTKFFNTLPIEIRAVCITTFTIACVLGLLKIIKS